jgi:DNA-binding NtrC family response regulator
VAKVLLVDDEVGLLAMTLRWLVEDKLEVVACHSVEAARTIMDAWRPDVLITDVRVAGSNGIYLAVLAAQRVPPVPAIVMSGFDDPVLKQEVRDLNGAFILKPLHRQHLVNEVRRALPDSSAS